MLAAADIHWWYRGRRRIVRAELEALDLPATARLLYAGCGGGQSVNLPAVAVGQSAHFRYHARSADRVPVAILDLLEWHWSMMSSF